MIIHPTRTVIRNYRVAIPPLPELVAPYERTITPIKTIPVFEIALNTFDLDGNAVRRAVDAARRETGLPACDPVRLGVTRSLMRFPACKYAIPCLSCPQRL